MSRTPFPQYSLTKRADGRDVVRLLEEPTLKPFAHKPIWTAKDAAAIVERLAEWFESPYGLVRLRREQQARPDQPEPIAMHHDVFIKDGDVEQARRAAHYRSQDFLTVLADKQLIEMAEAASLTAPDEELSRLDFPTAAGIVILQEAHTFPDFFAAMYADNESAEYKLVPLRGIEWMPNGAGNGVLLSTLVDGPLASLNNELDAGSQIQPPGMHKYLVVDRQGVGVFPEHFEEIGVTENDSSLMLTVKLLRSIFAIATSAGAESEDRKVAQTPPKTKKKTGSTPKRKTSTVRVISLRNPEYGRFELDAATGRKLRAHWVRGHWRRQWYASQEEHRSIWIEGFLRGDTRLGTVSGPRVYRATAPAHPSTQEKETLP